MCKVRNFFCHLQKIAYFCSGKDSDYMNRALILLLVVFPLHAYSAPKGNALPQDTLRRDTLKQVEVKGDSVLRVNEAIRRSIGKEQGTRIGYPSVSDVLGPRITDKIMHPFAVKDRKKDKKHARDRKILEEYERLLRDKTFEELLDEAIRKQAIEDGKEPPTKSGKK